MASQASGSNPQELHVVQLDTRNLSSASDLRGYKEATVPESFLRELAAKPKTIVCQSMIAEKCGLNVKIYFSKGKEGLAPAFRSGGQMGVMMKFQSDPAIQSRNNGAASLLTTDPKTGLVEYYVEGRAYVVQDNGETPLTKGQVWGLVEMVDSLMGKYDMDPESMIEGQRTLDRWAQQYRKRTWKPPSRSMNLNIYPNPPS